MELRFQNIPLRCMRRSAWETRNDEQTLEIRMMDNMPPVGKILAYWGQPIIRGKEWKNDQAIVSGGVMVWVLYDAEDGSGPKNVEGWIPFQFKWDLKDSVRDGVIQSSWLLRSIDARLTGAGKLLVRASVSAYGEALEGADYELYSAGDLPEDVHALTEKRTICVPVEAGEKQMILDDEIVIPPSAGEVDQILAFMLRPVVTEKKLMSDKIVFRGNAKLQVVYMGVDGRIHTYETDIPISQYIQLEREYGPDTKMWLMPEVSELELEKMEPERLRLKGAIIGQYVICDMKKMDVVTDAYSNRRTVELQREKLMIPNLVSDTREGVGMECIMPVQMEKYAAGSMWMGHPTVKKEGIKAAALVEGTAQILYYDPEGQLRSEHKGWEQTMESETWEGDSQGAIVCPEGYPVMSDGSNGTSLSQDGLLAMQGWDERGIDLVTGLTLGEMTEADPERPSLVMSKPNGKNLWELAKSCASTVSAIQHANGIDGQLDPDRILLIPVE